jgi:Tol biopolymer transport system component
VGRDVHLLDLAGARYARLTIDPSNGMYPTWSPDGSRIAFMSWRTGATELWVMNADGSDQRRLTETAWGDAIDPRWSPDGKRIAFVHVPQGLVPGGPRVIHTLDLESGAVERLSRWDRSRETLRALLRRPVRRLDDEGSRP